MVDIQRLEAALARTTIAGEVRFDDGARAAYAADASNYRQVPIGVVLPRSVEDIVAAVARVPRARRADPAARRRHLAQRADGQRRGGDRLLEVPRPRARASTRGARIARVEPGVVCDALRDAAEAHGLTFAPDPATHSRCTLGGMIGNNSCGPHSVMAGKTVENIERARGADLRRRALLVRPDLGRVEFAAHHATRRAAGARSTAKLQGPRRQLRRPDPRAVSRRSSAASRATTSTSCCRRTASTWRARWSAPRAPARSRCRRRRGW